MKKILIPQESKIIPKEALHEINKFEYINKSPFSDSYYNTNEITWDYKPEGSIRISDHWNFISKGKLHCQLSNTTDYIEDCWYMAQYKEGKYKILKEFGKSIKGYTFLELNKKDLELLRELYNMSGIVKSYLWYKLYKIKPFLSKEASLKTTKYLTRYISTERVKKYKSQNPKVKKVIFLDDETMSILDLVFNIYDYSAFLDKLAINEESIKILSDTYNAYIFNNISISEDKKYILVLDNNLAIDFTEKSQIPNQH